jgi:hypothetical protein
MTNQLFKPSVYIGVGTGIEIVGNAIANNSVSVAAERAISQCKRAKEYQAVQNMGHSCKPNRS